MARVFSIAVLSFMSLFLTGCTPEEKKPIWEETKLGDLATPNIYQQPYAQLFKTINFDVHVFEIPAKNAKELNAVWNNLYSRPFEFNNRFAFAANLFVARFGQMPMWDKIQELLTSAECKKALKVSLLLTDNRSSDITITGLDRRQRVFHFGNDGSRESELLGPGILVLRVKAVRVPGSRGVCVFVAQPVLTQQMQSPIPELAHMARFHEFDFSSAGFGLKMSPGDFVVLGPAKYLSDRSSLGGLFFSKPEGSLFLNETRRKMPKHKPAVRIFVLVCTGIGD